MNNKNAKNDMDTLIDKYPDSPMLEIWDRYKLGEYDKELYLSKDGHFFQNKEEKDSWDRIKYGKMSESNRMRDLSEEKQSIIKKWDILFE